jgi:DNA-binding NarL/FixJ family response regulator
MHNEPVYVKKALEAGAKGYVTKNSPLAEINKAIEEVIKGNEYICEEILEFCF